LKLLDRVKRLEEQLPKTANILTFATMEELEIMSGIAHKRRIEPDEKATFAEIYQALVQRKEGKS